jgi:hypothetical protein
MTAAEFAAMSDPDRNRQFSRPWTEPPPEKEGPAPPASGYRAQNKTTISNKTNNSSPRLAQRRRPSQTAIDVAISFLSPRRSRDQRNAV